MRANPQVPSFLLFATRLSGLFVITAGVVGFFAPVFGSKIWAWAPAPFSARYIGVIYLATLPALIPFVLRGRWSPGRVVLPMIFVFATTIAIVMLANPGHFIWTRPFTYVYWALYVFIPVYSGAYLYRLRSLPVADGVATSPAAGAVLSLLAITLAAYGLALLLVPLSAAGFWPWPVNAFEGRMYAATFPAQAVGLWLLRTRASRAEWLAVGGYLALFGLLTSAGVVWTSSEVPLAHKVHFEAAGTWAFFAISAVIALAGAWVMATSRRRNSRSSGH